MLMYVCPLSHTVGSCFFFNVLGVGEKTGDVDSEGIQKFILKHTHTYQAFNTATITDIKKPPGKSYIGIHLMQQVFTRN